MSQLTDAALKVAQSQVGQMEKPLGSNWGQPVESYLASVGITEPASWCMAFIVWCFDQASSQLGIADPLTKTGAVVHAWNVAYPIHKSTDITGYTPQPGDIFIMEFTPTAGHTGIVEMVNSDGSLGTIEGNTDDTGSPQGIGVYRRTRHFVPPIVGFLRYP
jgi:hypothetical protein